MWQFLTTLTNLLRFRAGPQDMPGWKWLPAALLSFNLILQFSLFRYIEQSGLHSAIIVSTVLYIGLLWLLLKWANKAERFWQTLSSILAAALVFNLILAPMLKIIAENPQQPPTGIALGYLAIFFWSLSVDAHIYRNSFSTNWWFGFMMTLGFYLLQNTVVSLLRVQV